MGKLLIFKNILPFVAFILVLGACGNETEPVDENFAGYDYVPLETGKYVIYSCDSIVFDNQGITRDTLKSYLKYEVGNQFTNANGETGFKLNKYWKKNLGDAWYFTHVDEVYKTDSKAIFTEGNLPFISMVFPNQKKTTWDGNALFDNTIEKKVAGEPIQFYQDWSYNIVSRDQDFQFNSETLKTLLVNQVDFESIIAKRYATESYAKGIGLIGKEMIIYNTSHFRQNEPWENFAESGFHLIQNMIEHN